MELGSGQVQCVGCLQAEAGVQGGRKQVDLLWHVQKLELRQAFFVIALQCQISAAPC